MRTNKENGIKLEFEPKFYYDEDTTRLYKRIGKKLAEYGASPELRRRAHTVIRFDEWEQSVIGKSADLILREGLRKLESHPGVPAAIRDAKAPLPEKAFVAYFFASVLESQSAPKQAMEEFDWLLYFKAKFEVEMELREAVRDLAKRRGVI